MKVTGVACKSGAILPVTLNASSGKCPFLEERVELDAGLHLMAPIRHACPGLCLAGEGVCRGYRVSASHTSSRQQSYNLHTVRSLELDSGIPVACQAICVWAISRPVGEESHASKLQLLILC